MQTTPGPSPTEPTSIEQQIGRRIRDARRAQGLTQEEVALAANVATRALHYIEHGRVRPRLDTVQRILSVLGMTLEIASTSAARIARDLDRSAAEEPRPPGSSPRLWSSE
jgi:transcriptional regulator with XRE-family HTH domain